MADGKKRGRKPRSVSPVTLTIQVTGNVSMVSRVDNLIDDLGPTAEILSATQKEDGSGFSYLLRYATGPEGRIARKGIANSLAKLKSKGRISGAIIATNVISV
jgi:hypothetical protein